MLWVMSWMIAWRGCVAALCLCYTRCFILSKSMRENPKNPLFLNYLKVHSDLLGNSSIYPELPDAVFSASAD